MTTTPLPPITRSLEDYRREQLMSVDEWAAHLGMTEQTYRRMLANPESVRMATKRKARAILKVSPYLVREFYPQPSPTVVAQALEAYRQGNADGWIATDPDSGETTGEVFDGAGRLINSQRGA
ncbi:MAG: hypothetical protein EI684_18065 [Candidatus Viridilinea halotolerans]|uniref:Uncharacterized protein n=1 Tax=Candidatus Viridilinea halotolerans TaxID=2491704 RepID=A0A426TTN0_9CHLR|nr:MAG: hypothetical protein EI684_18065 [Candidatus Viridilinea halotolerans]